MIRCGAFLKIIEISLPLEKRLSWNDFCKCFGFKQMCCTHCKKSWKSDEQLITVEEQHYMLSPQTSLHILSWGNDVCMLGHYSIKVNSDYIIVTRGNRFLLQFILRYWRTRLPRACCFAGLIVAQVLRSCWRHKCGVKSSMADSDTVYKWVLYKWNSIPPKSAIHSGYIKLFEKRARVSFMVVVMTGITGCWTDLAWPI